MICLATKCPNAELVFFTPDTDVLILVIGHYDKLGKRTSISMVSGIIHSTNLESFGQGKGTALPIFYAFTGTDNVGKFSGIS